MKKYIIIVISVLIIALIVVFSIIMLNNKNIKTENVNTNIEDAQNIEPIKKEEEEMVVNLKDKLNLKIGLDEKKEEEPKEEKKDAATLTQEIYSINGPIGRLKIPKTGVDTEVFSNQTVSKMEEMPCFLYTTGGLNEVGTTLFVGHNRRNGTLFSDNGKLKIGDEFYFTDLNGKELKYIIYSKSIKEDIDTTFLNEEVTAPTIALSCCTDANDEYRIVILGKAE